MWRQAKDFLRSTALMDTFAPYSLNDLDAPAADNSNEVPEAAGGAALATSSVPPAELFSSAPIPEASGAGTTWANVGRANALARMSHEAWEESAKRASAEAEQKRQLGLRNLELKEYQMVRDAFAQAGGTSSVVTTNGQVDMQAAAAKAFFTSSNTVPSENGVQRRSLARTEQESSNPWTSYRQLADQEVVFASSANDTAATLEYGFQELVPETSMKERVGVMVDPRTGLVSEVYADLPPPPQVDHSVPEELRNPDNDNRHLVRLQGGLQYDPSNPPPPRTDWEATAPVPETTWGDAAYVLERRDKLRRTVAADIAMNQSGMQEESAHPDTRPVGYVGYQQSVAYDTLLPAMPGTLRGSEGDELEVDPRATDFVHIAPNLNSGGRARDYGTEIMLPGEDRTTEAYRVNAQPVGRVEPRAVLQTSCEPKRTEVAAAAAGGAVAQSLPQHVVSGVSDITLTDRSCPVEGARSAYKPDFKANVGLPPRAPKMTCVNETSETAGRGISINVATAPRMSHTAASRSVDTVSVDVATASATHAAGRFGQSSAVQGKAPDNRRGGEVPVAKVLGVSGVMSGVTGASAASVGPSFEATNRADDRVDSAIRVVAWPMAAEHRAATADDPRKQAFDGADAASVASHNTARSAVGAHTAQNQRSHVVQASRDDARPGNRCTNAASAFEGIRVVASAQDAQRYLGHEAIASGASVVAATLDTGAAALGRQTSSMQENDKVDRDAAVGRSGVAQGAPAVGTRGSHEAASKQDGHFANRPGGAAGAPVGGLNSFEHEACMRNDGKSTSLSTGTADALSAVEGFGVRATPTINRSAQLSSGLVMPTAGPHGSVSRGTVSSADVAKSGEFENSGGVRGTQPPSCAMAAAHHPVEKEANRSHAGDVLVYNRVRSANVAFDRSRLDHRINPSPSREKRERAGSSGRRRQGDQIYHSTRG